MRFKLFVNAKLYYYSTSLNDAIKCANQHKESPVWILDTFLKSKKRVYDRNVKYILRKIKK